jgi:hypothetical protein
LAVAHRLREFADAGIRRPGLDAVDHVDADRAEAAGEGHAHAAYNGFIAQLAELDGRGQASPPTDRLETDTAGPAQCFTAY